MNIADFAILAFAAVSGGSTAPTGIPPSNTGDGNHSIIAETTAHDGFRISERGDFQIVEHGHWEPPYRPLPTQVSASVTRFPQHRQQQQKAPKKFASNFRRATFLGDVRAAEMRFGLPHGLLDAVIWTESRYNPSAVSIAGAAGLGQLMPGTARDLGVRNRFDPQANITGAAKYLRQMLDRFGVVHLAVAAYNAGPGAVARLGRIPLNGETPKYVRDVLDRWTSS